MSINEKCEKRTKKKKQILCPNSIYQCQSQAEQKICSSIFRQSIYTICGKSIFSYGNFKPSNDVWCPFDLLAKQSANVNRWMEDFRWESMSNVPIRFEGLWWWKCDARKQIIKGFSQFRLVLPIFFSYIFFPSSFSCCASKYRSALLCIQLSEYNWTLNF